MIQSGVRIRISEFPFPPSENELRENALVWSKNLGRRIARQKNSATYLAYQRDCEVWRLRNRFALQSVRQAIQGWKLIELQAYYVLCYNRIFCQDGRPKKFDVSNRDKALHDCLAPMLGIDDREFFRVSGEKIVRNFETADSVTLVLREVSVRTEYDLEDALGKRSPAILIQQG